MGFTMLNAADILLFYKENHTHLLASEQSKIVIVDQVGNKELSGLIRVTQAYKDRKFYRQKKWLYTLDECTIKHQHRIMFGLEKEIEKKIKAYNPVQFLHCLHTQDIRLCFDLNQHNCDIVGTMTDANKDESFFDFNHAYKDEDLLWYFLRDRLNVSKYYYMVLDFVNLFIDQSNKAAIDHFNKKNKNKK